jgi:tRNA A37 threonylcarbamoyladenosine synthetase subunit TsaC/SUA5/YrdC
VLRNNENLIIQATAANNASKASCSLEQSVDYDFNKKLDIIKAEFQLEFRKLRD